jgi:hypothetical protein
MVRYARQLAFLQEELMKNTSILLRSGIAIAAMTVASAAQAIAFVGTGWTLDVTITSAASPPGSYSNSFQDADTARLEFNLPFIGTAANWEPSTRPGIPGVTPDPNTVTGTYSLVATAGYQLTGLDLTGAGVWASTAARTAQAGNVVLDGAAQNYSFAQTVGGNLGALLNSLGLPSILGAGQVNGQGGTWAADATDLSFAPGTFSHGGSFSFTNDPAGGGFNLSAMAGGTLTGPEFTISVSAIPEPHEYALMLAGLGIVPLIARRRNRAKV